MSEIPREESKQRFINREDGSSAKLAIDHFICCCHKYNFVSYITHLFTIAGRQVYVGGNWQATEKENHMVTKVQGGKSYQGVNN